MHKIALVLLLGFAMPQAALARQHTPKSALVRATQKFRIGTMKYLRRPARFAVQKVRNTLAVGAVTGTTIAALSGIAASPTVGGMPLGAAEPLVAAGLTGGILSTIVLGSASHVIGATPGVQWADKVTTARLARQGRLPIDTAIKAAETSLKAANAIVKGTARWKGSMSKSDASALSRRLKGHLKQVAYEFERAQTELDLGRASDVPAATARVEWIQQTRDLIVKTAAKQPIYVKGSLFGRPTSIMLGSGTAPEMSAMGTIRSLARGLYQAYGGR